MELSCFHIGIILCPVQYSVFLASDELSLIFIFVSINMFMNESSYFRGLKLSDYEAV